MFKSLLIMGSFVCLSGCFEATSVTWDRADGSAIRGNAALERQFQTDESICQGEMAKADLSGERGNPNRVKADEAVYRGCMASRGYAVR